MSLDPNIKAVCFDAFGTVVDILDKRRPYVSLLQAMDSAARLKVKDKLMRDPISLKDCIARYASNLDPKTHKKILTDLETELASITLRPHLGSLWHHLKAHNYKIAICSNLAEAYGETLTENLPFAPDALILSYETSSIKPEAEIYQSVCEALNLSPSEIFFTGDTQSADVDGPKAFGMSAMLIDEFVAKFRARS